MYEKSAIAQKSIADSREKLQAPPRAATAWEGLPMADKLILCRAAQVSASRAKLAWFILTPCERGAIRQAAERAGQWAKKLGMTGAAL